MDGRFPTDLAVHGRGRTDYSEISGLKLGTATQLKAGRPG
jgi:hypothetical protein